MLAEKAGNKTLRMLESRFQDTWKPPQSEGRPGGRRLELRCRNPYSLKRHLSSMFDGGDNSENTCSRYFDGNALSRLQTARTGVRNIHWRIMYDV